jgi:DNA-binding transcriptional MerR regulator
MPHTDRANGLKVGDAAEASGLTVRTLHHYDSIGLAAPSGRDGAGHRVYAAHDVERLCVISSLRPLGLPLSEIRSVLDGPGARPVLAARLAQLILEIEHKDRLRRQLAELLAGPAATTVRTGPPRRMKAGGAVEQQTVQHPIAVLVYADLERAYRHLVDVFQLGPGLLARDDERPGGPCRARRRPRRGVAARESERFALRSPATLGGATSSIAVMVADVDAHFEHARAHGPSSSTSRWTSRTRTGSTAPGIRRAVCGRSWRPCERRG